MRCTARGLVAALIVCILTGLAGAACGQPQSSSATPDGPNATATALFVNTNRKLALVGEPTRPAGTDPEHPFAHVTFPPETPQPMPTSLPPACGATIAGWDEIVSKYGGFLYSNHCYVMDSQLVIAVEGVGNTGAIATYRCQTTDASCLAGNAPSTRGAAWSVYPAPRAIAIVGFYPPDMIRLRPQSCFNLASHTYDPDIYDCTPHRAPAGG
jgi:hypothetical protein